MRHTCFGRGCIVMMTKVRYGLLPGCHREYVIVNNEPDFETEEERLEAMRKVARTALNNLKMQEELDKVRK